MPNERAQNGMPIVIAIYSRGIARIPHLDSFLGQPVARCALFLYLRGVTAVAGWGLRPSTKAAREAAARHHLPYLALEDGFLRSAGLGVNGQFPLSIVIDDLRIYYDATQPSRLERLIEEGRQSAERLVEARQAMALIRSHQLSKYNHAPPAARLPGDGTQRILVVDQTAGDMSVTCGCADASSFRAMLSAALSDHPHATIYIKTHPDVLAGKKASCFGSIPHDARIAFITDEANPISVIAQVDKVYVVTSQMGFEALVMGKEVACFGIPWYAGWGLTDDRNPGMAAVKERRTASRSLEQLFAAAYLQYTRYIKPDTGEPGTIFDVIDHLVMAKAANDTCRGTLYCLNMSLWKRAAVTPFLTTPSSRLKFVSSLDRLKRMTLAEDAKIVIWGRRNDEDVTTFAAERNIPVMRMEDGFLRSVGLGSDLRRPLSLVLDPTGIYYDPRTPSALENWLKDAVLTDTERQRAAALRARLVTLKLSKYNVGIQQLQLAAAPSQRIILVPGQVEDDASIRFGSPFIRTNEALLNEVRKTNPDAYIVYKPHPDVLAKNRKGVVEQGSLLKLCNAVVTESNIIDCIAAADEVHTMTSQAGFEALMLGKAVVCYGQPFYSGWGLTTDLHPPARRNHAIDLDTLVYGALVAYPRYIDPVTLQFISVERAVDLLAEARSKMQNHSSGTSIFARQYRKCRELVRVFGKAYSR